MLAVYGCRCLYDVRLTDTARHDPRRQFYMTTPPYPPGGRTVSYVLPSPLVYVGRHRYGMPSPPPGTRRRIGRVWLPSVLYDNATIPARRQD